MNDDFEPVRSNIVKVFVHDPTEGPEFTTETVERFYANLIWFQVESQVRDRVCWPVDGVCVQLIKHGAKTI